MTFTEIVAFLVQRFGEEIIRGTDENATPSAVYIKASHIAEVCLELYENDQTYFDFLSCLSAVDNGPEEGTMEVVYHLYSIPYAVALCLKVQLPRNKEGEPLPEIPSVSYIWRGANWHEREAYDLLGIRFTGHPDMRRILLAADWEGYPLRKDYQLQTYYHGIKVAY